MLVSREEEKRILNAVLKSSKSEFVAIYGRRRIGKTFLIRTFFVDKKCIFFNVTGSKNGTMNEQISHFIHEISRTFYNGVPLEQYPSWDKTFSLLTKTIESMPKNKKIVLFFDELPWMATAKSKCLQSLDYYWNQYWSNDPRIKLIICGSSASWILNKIINDRGGLHNRITRFIALEGFNLKEAKEFLSRKKIKLTNNQILKLYMVLGGVPYYLEQVSPGLSAVQVIEQLSFTKKGFLLNEFDNLFASLFKNHELSLEIIKTIAANRYGIGQEELFSKVKDIKGKLGLTKLQELQDADFIISFKPHWHQRRGIYYKVIDEYSLFYLKWIEPIKKTLITKGFTKGYWNKHQDSASWHSWAGLTFESICYKHLPQISKALDLSPTAIPNVWRYIPRTGTKENGAQIDLLFDRDDDSITICEIKYTNRPFKIDKQYANNLHNKVEIFKKRTKTNKQIFIAIISANGLQPSIYSKELISNVVTLDDLFR